MDLVEDYRHTPENQAIYALRKETVERVFADAKEKHGMRYTPYRGLAQVTKVSVNHSPTLTRAEP